MRWIKSGGGPLVCIERRLARLWRGVDGNSTPRHIDTNDTDYERACGIGRYVGQIPVGDRVALVLGDSPLETSVAWLRGDPVLVRLIYADPHVDFQELLSSTPDSAFENPSEALAYDAESEEHLIFDSAASGDEAERNGIIFSVRPGRLAVLTASGEPNDRTSWLLHRFVRVS